MKYFTIKELCKSAVAEANGIENMPNKAVMDSLKALVENVLDPVRERYGKSIKVNSGYRSPELNRKVKGAVHSQHIKGEAADITAGSASENNKLYNIICKMNFDQVIDENNMSWIHVSYTSSGNRRMKLKLP